MSDLLTVTSLDPSNIKVDKISRKQLYVMKDLSLPDGENPSVFMNTPDFELKNPPLQSKKTNAYLKVTRCIYREGYDPSIILTSLLYDPQEEPTALPSAQPHVIQQTTYT